MSARDAQRYALQHSHVLAMLLGTLPVPELMLGATVWNASVDHLTCDYAAILQVICTMGPACWSV